MQEWIENPVLMERDETAEFVEALEINLDELKDFLFMCAK